MSGNVEKRSIRCQFNVRFHMGKMSIAYRPCRTCVAHILKTQCPSTFPI